MKRMSDSSFEDFEIIQTDEKCIIEFNNHLRSYSGMTKITDAYKDMIKELNSGEPLMQNSDDLITLQKTWPMNNRGEGYSWQMLKRNDSVLFFELYSDWQGYAHESTSQPHAWDDDINEKRVYYPYGRITILPPDEETQEIIKSVLRKYPARAEKK